MPGGRAKRPPANPTVSRLQYRTQTRTWIHAWLMLGPSLALLILFTHWPAVNTLIDSVYSTPRPRRPSRFVGPANFE
jgi:sn-glycerol 3-phosphate transport system permease protein